MPSPIIAIDHLRISVADLPAAEADYQLLLGSQTESPERSGDRDPVLLGAGNTDLMLVQSERPQGLEAICFRVDDLERIQRRLQRLGLDPQPVQASSETAPASELNPLLRIEARGLELLFVTRPDASAPTPSAPAVVSGLDHVVIASTDAQATAFLLAAQLDLDMRMDMSRPEWGARLLFFRCGDSIVEVVQNLDEAEATDRDRFFGISWRVHEADAARTQLCSSGFDVSEVRRGRRPGTRVMTVRDRTSGVATLLLQPPPS